MNTAHPEIADPSGDVHAAVVDAAHSCNRTGPTHSIGSSSIADEHDRAKARKKKSRIVRMVTLSADSLKYFNGCRRGV
jgi:hypothetical protein